MRLAPAIALVALLAIAMPANAAPYDLAAQRAKLAPVRMTTDTAFLTGEEKKVVNLLIQAANLMSQIYLRQVSDTNPAVRAAIAASDRPEKAALLAMFDLHFGPWDALADDHPFYGSTPKPAGSGFYPADLTKAQFDAYLTAHPAEKATLIDPYTVVRREGGKLIAIPYSVAYRAWLEPAARLLEQAAATTGNASLKTFLTLRAKAFRDDDYFQSELAWMDVKDTPIEIAIGPYEVYADELYGAKTAFEAYVTIRDPKASAALDVYKSHLRDMEANLPVEERYKNFRRGFASPIAVVEQVHGGGGNVPGIQTVAFNLPNDERVREAKGAKKVILTNVLDAKYARILQPMAALVLAPDQAALVSKRYMTLDTLFHELSHSLGPGSINVHGRATTVDKELKELGSGFEEAKADIMGIYNILYMMRIGVIPAAERPRLFATYLTGVFRAVRFGVNEAHGRGAAMQYGFLKAQGAFAWDAKAKRFRIDGAKMEKAVGALVGAIVRLQGDGDYPGVKAFLDRWAMLDDPAQSVIATMIAIPVDIQPLYPERI